MDVKVYKKETVLQPEGAQQVYVPSVIDIIPEFIEVEADSVINNTWTLESLKRIADVKIENNRLIINSDKVTYANGNLYAHVTEEQMIGCELAEGKEELEQQCALATIFQKGLDPLDLEDGIRWSEAILEEISTFQLIQDIMTAVENVTSAVTVVFDIVEDAEGRTYLSYKLQEAL